MEAVMVMTGPRGLFPVTVTFADITNALRQILAKVTRFGRFGRFAEFRAEIIKGGMVVAEMAMRRKQSSDNSEVATA